MTKKGKLQEYFVGQVIRADENYLDSEGNIETFIVGEDQEEYLVLTDSQADDRVKEKIKDDVWTFNSSFLRRYVDLPADLIETIQQRMYEDANEVFVKLIDAGVGMTQFIEDAVIEDGRGAFLSPYDHEEIDLGNGYYAYRQN